MYASMLVWILHHLLFGKTESARDTVVFPCSSLIVPFASFMLLEKVNSYFTSALLNLILMSSLTIAIPNEK